MDSRWTQIERILATGVVALECGALTSWVLLKGLSTPATSESAAGWVTRATLGSVALALIGFFGSRRWPRWRAPSAIAGMVLGTLAAQSWIGFLVEYTSNVLNWLQQASTLTLFGGLRGIGTRLTILLFMIGASLATSSGRHITVDLFARLLPKRWARATFAVDTVFAVAVCGAASWGFFDHVAIESFGARADASPGAKIEAVASGLGEHAFVLRKQLLLDARSVVPVAIQGRRYADFLDGTSWNQWLTDNGFEQRYGAERARTLQLPPDQTRAPMVVIPGLGEPRGLLAASANLLFPLGLLVVATRFLLRAAVILSDPDAATAPESSEPSEG